MRKRLILIALIIIFLVIRIVSIQTISTSHTLIEMLIARKWTVGDFFYNKCEARDPSMMGGVSFELYGASGKHYYLHFPEDFKAQGRTMPPKVCTIEQAIDMIEGALMTGRGGYSREICNYEDFKAIDHWLRMSSVHELKSSFYAIVGLSARLVEFPEMSVAEMNTLLAGNETKIDKGWWSFLYYDVERDRQWIEENIIFHQ